MNCSTPGLPVHLQLLESTQTHIHWVGDVIQPSHPLLSPSLPVLNLSQHQGLFQWVSSSHRVARVLEFQLQHQSETLLYSKVHLVKVMVFPVVMYGCESKTIKKSWEPKNWCFWTVVLVMEIHPKGNQSWIFIGRTEAEAEALILWPPDVKSRLTGKDPDTGKDWGQEEKGATEDEMVGWHHQLKGHEFD